MMREYNIGMKKEKTKSNNNDTYTSQDLKRYLGALSETHNEHLKGIKEGFVIINRKLDEHSKILNAHSKILNEHSKILDEHSKKLDSHTEMIGNIMEDTTDLKQDMQFVKKELKRKVDYDEFLSLVQRVMKLEAKI